ncbi:MAG: hypothetical protein KF726_10905 [Anaerolineae bacterium]|nr:hypothetical protein [Anaerolineae bacterium]
MIQEPPITQGDTKPRRPVDPSAEPERRGCANPLLTAVVILALLGMFVMMLGVAAFAGYRDGGVVRQTQKAVALYGTMDGQATLAWRNLDEGNYTIARERCVYIIGINAQYPGMRNCVSTAEAALNATPTFTPSPTATITPLPTATVDTSASTSTSAGFTPDSLFNNAELAYQQADYETAQAYLEALRGLDFNYRKQEVEDRLVDVYLKLAAKYQAEGKLAQMVVVIQRARDIRNIDNTGWTYTMDATNLYLSARDYLNAQNYGMAAQVFRNLFAIGAINYLDSKTLGCEAFSKAGDTASFQQYCQ